MDVTPGFWNSSLPAPTSTAKQGCSASLTNFAFHCQEGANWCWVAVTQALLARRTNKSASQNWIAQNHAPAPQGGNLPQCTAQNCPGERDAPHSLRNLLLQHDLLSPGGFLRGPLDFAMVRWEIDHGRPIPCRIGWATGGAHFVCLAGYAEDATGANCFVSVLLC
ncbi:papain-like cysteine protease family protein [Roseomonas mucosa]|uniref:papain-like cysteine protease family protein n=1 Tax=Roseomonas mucosa TaxID=207340 RepID=UPI0028CC72C4|nr:papain-like cysteine protease family protein [Roseomonas mucosa]MDT8274834.1 papain-like cysteine protease family protein [Roseomonas mucosa]MDT8355496.1 papain-like cysteine protease family protein [Roseomonas mucosa]